MSDDAQLSRREALKLALATAVLMLSSSQLPAAAALRRAERSLLPIQLTTLLSNRQSAAALGRAYLAAYPHEQQVAALLNQIATSAAARDTAWPGQSLRDLLGQMLTDDFAADRVVILQGWVLSVTEARLCALALLLA